MEFNDTCIQQFNQATNGLKLSYEIHSANIPVIALTGVLDSVNSWYFGETIIKTMDANSDAIFFVFDLEKLDYISSIGIGSFTAILVHGKNNNTNIYLMNLDDKCMRLFKHLGLQHFFNIIDDIKEITIEHQ